MMCIDGLLLRCKRIRGREVKRTIKGCFAIVCAFCMICADFTSAYGKEELITIDGVNADENAESEDRTGNGGFVDISIGAGAPVISGGGTDEDITEINMDVPKAANIDPTLTINKGIYADDIDLSGMTYKEAKAAIDQRLITLRSKQIELISINDRVKNVTAGDMGLKWSNSDFLVEAIGLGKTGNIIARYKENKDLEVEHKVYDIDTDVEKACIKTIVQEESDECGSDAKDATLTIENGIFRIAEGQAGYGVDVDASVNKVYSEMSSWDKDDCRIELVGGMIEPKGKAADLEQIQDLLGSFTTSFSSSGRERSGNVRNGTKLLNGKLLYPGEQLSVYGTVSPFTEENGYFLAGSYSNGLVVESLGGGICQVSSTLYNAVLRAELQVDERSNHSMIVNYVDMSADAAISGTYKDFKFTNSLDTPIYIEGYTTDDKQVVFNIYGHETRPSNRKVSFETVEISKTEPEGEKIVGDSSLPVGDISVQSPHTGYVGELWKVVKVDGVETERTRVNKSTYQAVPKTATVGTAADNPIFTQMINTAIASGSIATCKETINQLKAMASGIPVVPVAPPAEAVNTEPAEPEVPPQDPGTSGENAEGR